MSSNNDDLKWKSQVWGIWYTVIVVFVVGVGHIVMAIHTFFFYDWTLIELVFSICYLSFVAYLIAAFITGFAKLAVMIRINGDTLKAKGLFGQEWDISLSEIEAFRDADIFLKGRKRPVIQIGVIGGGMRSFVEALQEHTSDTIEIENELLIKQGRW